MNKLLITVFVPKIEAEYEVFIPINKKVNTIIELLTKSVNELSGGHFPISNNLLLYNKQSGKIYDINMIIKNTDIRNGTSVILM